jgi:protein phosphatase
MTRAAGRTHPGRVRSANQDVFVVDPAARLYAVADGMGGHRGGEVASALAARTLSEFVGQSLVDSGITWPFGLEAHQSFEANQLRNAVLLGHLKIQLRAQTSGDLEDMGTTVVAAIVAGGKLTTTNVGDSRAYLCRRGSLTQLSVDHTWAAMAIKAGMDPADIRTDPRRHMVTHALGLGRTVDVPLREQPLEDGDVLLLCSDGLHGVVPDPAISRVLPDRRLPVEARADRLIDLANEAGGPDNVTAVVIEYGTAGSTT